METLIGLEQKTHFLISFFITHVKKNTYKNTSNFTLDLSWTEIEKLDSNGWHLLATGANGEIGWQTVLIVLHRL